MADPCIERLFDSTSNPLAYAMEKDTFSQQDFDFFFDVSKSIHAICDLDEMLRHILDKIRLVFRIEGASIALHEPLKREFYFIRTVEENSAQTHSRMHEMRFRDDLGIAGWVLRENRSVTIHDVTRDDRFYREMDSRTSFHTRSMICVPLRSRKGTIGVLYALNKIRGRFSTRETRLLESLSGTVAIAIENARLYGELKAHASSLEIENRQLKSEVQERFNVQGIIGTSAAMQQIFAMLDRVIPTTMTVLIQGETGTGKELIARVIHYNGSLKDKPFVAENCAALADSLLESELFGHVRGAFTGAVADKKGLFEIADGGTVFLDEIGETSPAMQAKLLRVLQEGEIRRIGGHRRIRVNVRLLASTNRDLMAEVKKGNFRKDLFYRINVFPVTLPPLRKRMEDIPLLAAHILRKTAAGLNVPVPRLSSRAMYLLQNFDWPGNIRELENEIQRAMALAAGQQVIGEEFLSPKLYGGDNLPLPQTRGRTLKEITANIEARLINETLQQTGGNRSQAASVLGLTRQGLLNKIKRYHIDS